MVLLKRKLVRAYGGFTLIEALAFLFLFSVVSLAFYQTFTLGLQHIHNAKNRLGATALASQKMEIIQSLPYGDIGTKRPKDGGGWLYGIPAGDILEDEAVLASGTNFQVHTFVQYVDDSYDGLASGGADAIPTDYKRVRVEVSWGSGGSDQTVAIAENFPPIGVESASNTGVLSINVLDVSGVGVPTATVHVVNASAGIDFTAQTDALGNLTLPGATPGSYAYRLTVSKNGYFGVATYPPYPTSPFDPVDVDASVAAGSVNQKTIVIDRHSDITLRTRDPFGTSISNVAFSLRGGRTLGTIPLTNPLETTFLLDESTTTNGSGEKTYIDTHYGQYTFALDPSEEDTYAFLKMTPSTATANIFNVVPNSTVTAEAVLADKSVSSLLVRVVNAADGAAVVGASVHLSSGVGYDATMTTDSFGQVFFPETLPALSVGTYDLEVSATGFHSENPTVNIPGNSLVEKMVQLNAL